MTVHIKVNSILLCNKWFFFSVTTTSRGMNVYGFNIYKSPQSFICTFDANQWNGNMLSATEAKVQRCINYTSIICEQEQRQLFKSSMSSLIGCKCVLLQL